MERRVRLYHGEARAASGFGSGHPFGHDRQAAFWQEALRQGLDWQTEIGTPVPGTEDDLALFHTADYIARGRRQSQSGQGYLDSGDTPAFPGVFEAGGGGGGSGVGGVKKNL